MWRLAESPCGENCSTRNTSVRCPARFVPLTAFFCVFFFVCLFVWTIKERNDGKADQGSISESGHGPLASKSGEVFVTDLLVLRIQNLLEDRHTNS